MIKLKSIKNFQIIKYKLNNNKIILSEKLWIILNLHILCSINKHINQKQNKKLNKNNRQQTILLTVIQILN